MDDLGQLLLKGSISAGLTVLATFFVVRARRRARQAQTGAVMRLSGDLLGTGLLSAVLFFGLAILSNVFSNETTTWWTTSIFLFFGSLGAYLVFRYFVQRHRLEETKLEFTNLVGIRYSIPWGAISSVNHSLVLDWFVVETLDKRRFHIAENMTGIRLFSEAVLARVDPGKITAKAMASLERLRDGRS